MKLEIRRLGYALGAEITGLDLRNRLDDATVAAIREAWLEHIVLRFPEQPLTPEGLLEFSSRFGKLNDNRVTPHLRHPDYPPIFVMVNKPVTINDKVFSGGIVEKWHTDQSHTDRPTTGSFLNAQDLPEVGGDTMFANMYAAYDALSPKLQKIIEPMMAVHDVSLAVGFNEKFSAELKEEWLRLNPPVMHRVVNVHPETGRKTLYLSDRIRNFVGMSEDETKPLLGYLCSHATRYEFVFRNAWKPGDLLMWDNRCSMHVAVRDYDLGVLRRMQRSSLVGPKMGIETTRDGSEVASKALPRVFNASS